MRRPTADTFPRLLRIMRASDRAHRHSREGSRHLAELELVADAARGEQIAAGLFQAGFQRGEHLAIIGENRPRLYFTMIAVQCLGGIPVPMYQDAVAPEMAFVFDNAEIHFAVVEDQEQVDKVLEIREKVPHLQQHYLRGSARTAQLPAARPASYEAMRAGGEQFLKQQPDVDRRRNSQGPGDRCAAMFYTSGTTGNPKGVVLGYDNLIAAGRAGRRNGGADRTKRYSRTCRWRGSARIFFRTRSGWCADSR